MERSSAGEACTEYVSSISVIELKFWGALVRMQMETRKVLLLGRVYGWEMLALLLTLRTIDQSSISRVQSLYYKDITSWL